MSFPRFVNVGDEVTNQLIPIPDSDIHFTIPFGERGVVTQYLSYELRFKGKHHNFCDWKFLVKFGDVEVVRYQDDLYWEDKK